MKVCPNPACPYAVKFKRPGEYQDVAITCSDCGSALVEPPAVAIVAPVATAPASGGASRLLVTLGSAAAVFALTRTPLFGMPQSVAGPSNYVSGMHLLDVGMTPFVSAFLLVEVVALILPPLRARRVGSVAERAPLNAIAMAIGFGLLLVQLAALVRFDQTQRELPPAELLWPQLILAHVAMIGLALVVTRRGLGNGFALVLGVTSINLVLAAAADGRTYDTGETSQGAQLLPIVIAAVAVFFAVRLSRAGRRGGEGKPTAVPFPVSGLGAWQRAGAAMAIPAALSPWLPQAGSLARELQQSWFVYTAVMTFIAFDLALLLGFLFFRPMAVGQLWARWNPGIDMTGVVVAARGLLPRALVRSIAFSVGVPVLLGIFSWAQNARPLGGYFILVVVVALVVTDIVDELGAWQRLGPLVCVRRLQRTAEVEPILFALREKGIEAHAQSFCYRVTEQFFAPYAPVGILVPALKAADARALLDGR